MGQSERQTLSDELAAIHHANMRYWTEAEHTKESNFEYQKRLQRVEQLRAYFSTQVAVTRLSRRSCRAFTHFA